MESTVWIKEAKKIIEEIHDFAKANLSQEEAHYIGNELQKKITSLFSVMINPSLPSAYKLRDCALEHNFAVGQQTLNRIAFFENIS